MKYRHSFHAGNFADIHKHVTLLALLTSLKRKEKGFAYFETHAGRGAYDLSHQSAEAAGGSGRFSTGEYHADELKNFAALLTDVRKSRNHPRAYPGSPVIAAHELR
ncbi:MAG: ribosomal large subunit methyltransferase, partial [Gammaproteobacteria bacterium]|nr:ribosomal large subunit methyltransferase [Gammaproteobacteria bacterium]